MSIIDEDISISQTLPSNHYTEKALFDVHRINLYNNWQFVGHNSWFAKSKKIPINLAGEPAIITHDNEKTRCISNVCTHRAMLLVSEAENGNSIKCPYHGRSFSLCGKMKNMPQFEGVENFPTNDDNLREFKLTDWKNFLFSRVEGNQKFSDFIAVIEKRMDFFKLDDLIYDKSMDRSHEINTNWLLYVDNYLEGFHIPYVHKELNDVLDYQQYQTETFDNAVLQIGYGETAENCFLIPENHTDCGKNIAAYYWWIFPNLMMNFYPWGLSINVVRPIDIGRTVVDYYGFRFPNASKSGAGSELDVVEHEDQLVVESCFLGMQSKSYNRGRYSVIMEKGVHHFHLLLTKNQYQ